MKTTQRDFAGAAPRAARQCSIFFFCGQDEAGASAAANKLAAMMEDPGERIELQGSDLKRDPALLGDEARSGSLFGDARHVYVRAAGDEAHDALEIYIQGIDAGQAAGCPVLIVATSASDKSRTAKLIEKRDDALVAMFYPPDLRSVTEEVRRMADTAGLRLPGDLAERIARASRLDVRLAQSEVEKLATYLDATPQAPKAADAAALDAIGAMAEDDGFMPLVNAVLSGETGRLSGELKRMREVSLNPVGLLLAFERRVSQLAGLSAKLGARGDIAALLEAETRARRVYFRDKRDLHDQLRRWQGDDLDRLVSRMTELHQGLLSNNQSAELLLSQGLALIARHAVGRR
ncbi:MAG TPA: DNA polymerase III subunit delta [Sphingomonadaceae bacterium]|nr:DNA polymerase III subunit delta [Sphingomonadaceae bacterium]